jgi:flagellar biosynthesis chaperone FliJ
MHDVETPPSLTQSSRESFPSYYLNNLITERTHGMGRAMSKQGEDFVSFLNSNLDYQRNQCSNF